MPRLSRDEFSKQFQIHFKMHLRSEWIDWLIMRLQPSKKMSFNVIKFDEYLHQQFGDYENDGKSMASIIEEKFGEAASKLIGDNL
jgi:hypothetical protein